MSFAEWALRVGANRTTCVPIAISGIPDRDKTVQGQGIARYISTKTLLVHHMKDTKYGCHWILLETWIQFLATAMRLEEPYA